MYNITIKYLLSSVKYCLLILLINVTLIIRSTFTTMAPVTAQEEFAKDKKLKMENIEYLREWMSKQPHLPAGITGKS